MRQIQEYEGVFSASSPPSQDAGDWSQIDRALQPWLSQRPLFADYYRWMAQKYESDPSSRNAFRYPSVLRANIDEYLSAEPGSRVAGTALPAPVAILRQPVRVGGWELAVVDWDNWGRRDLPWSAAGEVLRTDASWVVIVVALTNTTEAPLVATPGDFQLRDAAGRVSPHPAQPGAAALSAYRGGSAWERPVPPGATAYYYLPFAVDPNPGTLALVVNQDWRPVILIANP
jgi:hypothetical protein